MRENYRAIVQTKFSIKLWNIWLARLNGPHPHDPQANHLRAGIAHFRALCAQREKKHL